MKRVGIVGSDMRPEHQLLLACARVHLGAGEVERIRVLVKSELDFSFLISESLRHQLAPLLFWHLRAVCPESVAASDNGFLRRNFEETAQRSLYLASHLIRVLKILENGGIRAVPYKGPALAALAYRNLTLRPFADLDFLVRQSDITPCMKLLGEHGYPGAEKVAKGPGHARRGIPGQYQCRTDAGNVLLEFHTERTLRYFPRPMNFEDVTTRLQPVSICGHVVRTFSSEDMLITLCVHGTKHVWDRLIWICDVAELMRQADHLNWKMVIELSNRLGCARMVKLGLCLANTLLINQRNPATPDSLLDEAEVEPLLKFVVRQLLSGGQRSSGVTTRALFRIRSRDNAWQGLRHVLKVATAPTDEDWDIVQLPVGLSPIYRAIRPFRLLREYGLGAAGRVGGGSHPSEKLRTKDNSVSLENSAARLFVERISDEEVESGVAGLREGLVRLTRQGVVFSGSAAELESIHREFDQQHCILLKSFLDPELYPLILPAMERAQFYPEHYERVGSELRMEPNAALKLLFFITNDQELFKVVQTISRCPRIGCFGGRVYRMVPNPHHTFDWHSDLHEESRLIALSVNMSPRPYQGGLFQIREVNSGRMLREVANTGFGDAILFRISPDLEHRVTKLEGDIPKTAFAGWFKSEPDLHAALRRHRSTDSVLSADG